MSNTKRLRGLLTAAKDDRGLTLDDLVARSRGRLKRSTVHSLLTRPDREPMPGSVLRVVAEVFGVDYEVLRLAHLADMDLLPEGDPDAAPIAPPLHLPDGADRLTPKQRAAVGAVIAAMLDPESAAAAFDKAAADKVQRTRQAEVPDPRAKARRLS